MNRAGDRITDELGRTLILRGVNLGGSSKIPFAEAENPKGRSVSFTGRPFPLEEAEEHFEKLSCWGLTFTRFIVTWEALEHSGPGIYDESYLDYLEKIFFAAEKKGVSILLDPHQDVWSRRSGGDGAPNWTMEKLGMDLDRLEAAGAARMTRGEGMIWPVNYSLYAAATMFTLFFAGNAFAPDLKIGGENPQEYLQGRYLAAFRHCFKRLQGCKAIKAWGTMNEPHPGFIGYRNLDGLENVTLAKGPVPSPFQAMLAASGHTVKVPVYTPWFKGWKIIGRETINPPGLPLFKEGFSCPWKQAGVWSDEEGAPRLLKPDHFAQFRGRPVVFTDDFLKPFLLRFIKEMGEPERPSLFFIEGIPHGENPSWGMEDPKNVVNAFHHYDGFTLFTKSFRSYFTLDVMTSRIIIGRKKTAALFSSKLAKAKAWAKEHMNDMPCFLGEFGLPFDLNGKKAYKTGDYRTHEKALSLYYDGIDENLLGSAIWNYTADNTHDEGDHWNGEDLSIVSGGEPRAIGGWLRPYPTATAGIPLKFTWDRENASFCYRFRADAEIKAPTEVFVPSLWFDGKPSIAVRAVENYTSDRPSLRSEYLREKQTLYVYNDGYSGEAELIFSLSRVE